MGGHYAAATFGREGGAAQLDVSAEGVVFSNAGIGATGTYTLAATAVSDSYLGTARATLVLSLDIPRVEVRYAANPADESGGTVTVEGIESGGLAARGSEVEFVARPASEWHVFAWSDEGCAGEVGDAGRPGEERSCVLRADAALDVTVSFTRAGPIAAGEGLAAGARLASVAVAPGFVGEIYRAAPESALVEIAAGSDSHGRVDLFEAGTEGGTLAVTLHTALPSGSAEGVFTVTLEGVEAGARTPRAEFVTIRVRRLASPAAARIEIEGGDERTKSEAIVFDFAAANPDYAGATFEFVSGSAALTASGDGKVAVADKATLEEGESHRLRVAARGSQANEFLGSAEFELEVDVRITDDSVDAALPVRRADVVAVAGYVDPVYTLTLEAGSALSVEYATDSPPSGFLLNSSGQIYFAEAPTVSELVGLFTVRLSRGAGPLTRSAVVSLEVSVVLPPRQRELLVTLGDDGTPSGFPHAIAYPPGFLATDYQTRIAGVDGGASHFGVSNGALVAGSAQLTVGSYEITLEIQHFGMLGTLTVKVNARVGGFGDIADGDEIPAGAREAAVRVSPDYVGEVHRVEAGAGVDLILPESVDSGFSLARGATDNAAVFSLLSALGSEGEAAVAATVTQISGNVFERATLAVSVSALAEPEGLRLGVDATDASVRVVSETAVLTLSLGGLDAARLSFAAHSDEGGYFVAPPLSGSAGEVGVTLAPPHGLHRATIAAWSSASPPDFLGTLYYPIALDVRTSAPDAIPTLQALPQHGTTLTRRAAADYVGALLTLTSALADVVLRFPESERTAFDSREDFAYDYAANVLSLKRGLGVDGRATVAITLTAERVGYEVELTVSVAVEAAALNPAAAEINAAAGFAGALYDFARGDLRGAVFRRVSGSSALGLSAEGVVSAESALGDVGTRYTLVGAAEAGTGLQFFGAAEVSLEVEVSGFARRRGLYYREHDGECSALGAGWRLPGLTEAVGLVSDDISGQVDIDVKADAGESVFGVPTRIFPRSGQGGDAGIVGGWVESGLTGERRVVYENPDPPPDELVRREVSRVVVAKNGLNAFLDVLPLPDGGAFKRYCVVPVDGASYVAPLDPAVPCFANAERTGCGASPTFLGASQGDVYTVEILAGQGAELRRVSDAEFDLSVSASGADGLISHSAGSSSDVLTVELTVRRELQGAESAVLTVTPEVGTTEELVVQFRPGVVRRGLRFQQATSGVCSDLGSGLALAEFCGGGGTALG